MYNRYPHINNEFGAAWVASRRETHRGVFTPLSYVDINDGNISDAVLFAQIMYWHEVDADGNPRLVRHRDGHYWLVKQHREWFKETRLKKFTVRDILRRLKDRGLIFYEIHGEKGDPAPWIRINWDEFERRMKICLSENWDGDESCYRDILDKIKTEDRDDSSYEDAPRMETIRPHMESPRPPTDSIRPRMETNIPRMESPRSNTESTSEITNDRPAEPDSLPAIANPFSVDDADWDDDLVPEEPGAKPKRKAKAKITPPSALDSKIVSVYTSANYFSSDEAKTFSEQIARYDSDPLYKRYVDEKCASVVKDGRPIMKRIELLKWLADDNAWNAWREANKPKERRRGEDIILPDRPEYSEEYIDDDD